MQPLPWSGTHFGINEFASIAFTYLELYKLRLFEVIGCIGTYCSRKNIGYVIGNIFCRGHLSAVRFFSWRFVYITGKAFIAKTASDVFLFQSVASVAG